VAVGRKGRPEVGGDPDRWAPPVGGRVRERERSGPREVGGPERPARPRNRGGPAVKVR
jgi:hypothetical protein